MPPSSLSVPTSAEGAPRLRAVPAFVRRAPALGLGERPQRQPCSRFVSQQSGMADGRGTAAGIGGGERRSRRAAPLCSPSSGIYPAVTLPHRPAGLEMGSPRGGSGPPGRAPPSAADPGHCGHRAPLPLPAPLRAVRGAASRGRQSTALCPQPHPRHPYPIPSHSIPIPFPPQPTLAPTAPQPSPSVLQARSPTSTLRASISSPPLPPVPLLSKHPPLPPPLHPLPRGSQQPVPPSQPHTSPALPSPPVPIGPFPRGLPWQKPRNHPKAEL